MRLQLSIALVLVASAAHAADGGTAGARADVYIDESIVVIAPSARTSVDVGDGITVDGGYLVNIISGATPVLTPDAITSATRFTEHRHGIDLSIGGPLSEHVELTGGWMASLEGDFQALGPTVKVTSELFGEMARLSIGYRLRFERTQPSDGEPLVDVGASQEVDVTWTQILGRTTRVTLLVSGHAGVCGAIFGCQANPYRYVPAAGVSLREKHPANRFRVAAAARLSQALSPAVALHGGYRYYIDSWWVQGHTADLAVAVSLLGERLLFRATGRFGHQSAASFYRDDYAWMGRYVTGDRELSGLWDVMASVRGEWRAYAVGPFSRFGPSLRVAFLHYRYPHYSEAPMRNAWLIGAGVDAAF